MKYYPTSSNKDFSVDNTGSNNEQNNLFGEELLVSGNSSIKSEGDSCTNYEAQENMYHLNNSEADDHALLHVEIDCHVNNERDCDTSSLLSAIQENNNISSEMGDIEDECKLNDSLLTIMSDHNYTFSEKNIASSKIHLRSIMINHILYQNETTNKTKKANPQVTEFVNDIIGKLLSYNMKDEINDDNEKCEDESIDSAPVHSADEDIFVQNVMDAVGADEENENEKKLTQAIDFNKICLTSVQNCENDDLFHMNKTVANDLQTERKSDLPLSFPENFSEPLEHIISDVFDYKNHPKAISNNLLDEVMNFAHNLQQDCITFKKSSTNQELKLKSYILEQLNILKHIVYKEKSCVDNEQQTDSIDLPTNDMSWINKKNKTDLINNSSDSSVSSDDDQSTSVFNNLSKIIDKTSIKSPEMKFQCEIAPTDDESTYDSPTFNVNNDYDDGISMSQYIQSDIFESATRTNRESLSSERERVVKLSNKFIKTVSDNENSNDENGIVGIKKICDSFKKKICTYSESDKENKRSVNEISVNVSKEQNHDSQTSDDEDSKVDKEIERLININTLGKRPAYISSKSFKEIEKQKNTKVDKSKKKYFFFDYSDEELGKSCESDEGISEIRDEIITEEEYLVRHNETLKQELLNASSSASDFSDVEINEVDKNQTDEDGSTSPLVEKFLKNFIVEESDNEHVGSDVEIPDDQEHRSTNEYKLSNKEDQNKISSQTPSDNEFLHGERKYNKQHSQKTLEKMLSEVEKRKTLNKFDEDLISLSSESAGSDVESVENETADKKARIIKPMLRQYQLRTETRKAQKEEAERIRRLEKKQIKLAEILKKHDNDVKGDFILDYIEESKIFIKVHPGIVKQLKNHQFDGVKFMYDSCYGNVNTLKKHPGSGCILAHCMGLGKTLQLIALLHTVISYEELRTSKVLVLCPKSTVMNWSDEVIRWIAPLNTRNLRIYTFNDTSDIHEKIDVIKKWSQSSFGNAGALLIGYEAFRTLVHYHSYKNRSNIGTKILEDIRDKISSYLLKPGADLVVCDEGHIIKNSKSAISTAVSKILTPRRIILTGTPIQNNLKEYYSMVNFIKPLFLGTEKEFANLYANPIKNGQHKDSSKFDIKIMKQRSFVLHKKLSKFVQRKEAELLKTFLPQKFEYVLFLPMTDVQNNLYEYILGAISRRQENRGRTLITDYTCLRKIWTHPKVLEDAWKNATDAKNKRDSQKTKTPHSDDDQPDDIYDSQTGVMSVTNDWWRCLVNNNELETIIPSNKLRATFEILRMCDEKAEKCLIFSAFVAVLNVVEYFFKKLTNGGYDDFGIPKSTKTSNQWILGKDYYRLDGKTPKSLRHEMIKQFNMPDNKRARVFLISSKAGGQGINLIGANRVIILDTSWNPSNDQQNIFRIFRLGQKKKCYIYRLLAMGTMEEKVYSRSVTKQAMSYRVVDEQQIDRHYSLAELAELYTLTKPDFSQRPVPVLPQDNILASLMLNYPEMVYKYHEHDSLLENKIEQELSEQEKADAWIAYERDLQMSSQVQDMPLENISHGNFALPKLPNYMMPGLDMPSLLKYSTNNLNKTTSPYIKSLMAQYPQYPQSQQHQQYLDMLHLYQNYVMNFPGDSFNTTPNLYQQLSNPNQGHTNSAAYLASLHSNPLSALDDLSMYGIGTSKSVIGNMNSSSPFVSSVPSLNTTLSNLASSSSNGSNIMNATHNVVLAPFSQYNTNSLDKNFANHYNFSHNHYSNNVIASSNASINCNKLAETTKKPTNLSRDQFNKIKTSEILLNQNTSIPATAFETTNSISLAKSSQNFETNEPCLITNKQSSISMTPNNSSRDPLKKTVVTSLQNENHVITPTTAIFKNYEQNDYPSGSTYSVEDLNTSKSKLSRTTDSVSPRVQYNKSVTTRIQNQNNSTQSLTSKSSPDQKPKMNLEPIRGVQFSSAIDAIGMCKTKPYSNIFDNSQASAPFTTTNKEKNTYPKSNGNLNDNTDKRIQKTSVTALQPKVTMSTPLPTQSPVLDKSAKSVGCVNMGISYPSRSSPISKNICNNAENCNLTANPETQNLLRNNNEMQIILTSASTSIGKELSDISPSISLTAVIQKNATNTTPATPAPLSAYKVVGQLESQANDQSISTKQLKDHNVKSNMTPNESNIRKTHLQGQKPSLGHLNKNVRETVIPPSTKSSNILSTSISTINSPSSALLAKPSQKNKIGSANIFPQQLSSPVPVSISKNGVKNSTIQSIAQMQTKQLLQPPSASNTNIAGQISINSSNKSSNNVNNSNNRSVPQNLEIIKNNLNNRPLTGNALDSTTVQFDKSKMLLNTLSSSSRSSVMAKNAINIRPACDFKNKSANKEAYVIETNINDRRFKIGTPTKSGGGTTITKISKKRTVQDDSINQSRDTTSSKRFKQSIQ